MSTPRAPVGLSAAARRFWRSVLAVYELSPAELETLRQACTVVDLLARLDEKLAAAPALTVRGSTGQPTTHPAVRASAEQRRTLAGLLRDLSLPMPDEVAGARKSPAQLLAAQTRWREEKARKANGQVARAGA